MNRSKTKQIILAACVLIVVTGVAFLTLRNDPPPTVIGDLTPSEAADLAHYARGSTQSYIKGMFDYHARTKKDYQVAASIALDYPQIHVQKIQLDGTNKCIVTLREEPSNSGPSLNYLRLPPDGHMLTGPARLLLFTETSKPFGRQPSALFRNLVED